MTSSPYIGLLRGINVGGHNRIPMSELRSLCVELGWTEVDTYIQSGNLVFRAAGEPAGLEGELEQAIERHFGLAIPVLVRSADQWNACLKSNPYPEISEGEPNFVMLALSKTAPKPTAVEVLQARATNGER